jgi:hypothetical protein
LGDGVSKEIEVSLDKDLDVIVHLGEVLSEFFVEKKD